MLQVRAKLRDNKASVWICASLKQQQTTKEQPNLIDPETRPGVTRGRGGRQAHGVRGAQGGNRAPAQTEGSASLPGKDGEGCAWRKHSSNWPLKDRKEWSRWVLAVGVWQRRPRPALARWVLSISCADRGGQVSDLLSQAKTSLGNQAPNDGSTSTQALPTLRSRGPCPLPLTYPLTRS